jgi:hypothetical protein
MSRSEEEFGCSVPDCDYYFVTTEERVKWFVEESGKTEISYFEFAARSDHDICWLQVSVQNPVSMEILTSIKQLEHDTLHRSRWNGMTSRLSVVMDDLQEIMLGVFKDHEDAFVFQDDLMEFDDINMTKFGTQGHLPDS